MELQGYWASADPDYNEEAQPASDQQGFGVAVASHGNHDSEMAVWRRWLEMAGVGGMAEALDDDALCAWIKRLYPGSVLRDPV